VNGDRRDRYFQEKIPIRRSQPRDDASFGFAAVHDETIFVNAALCERREPSRHAEPARIASRFDRPLDTQRSDANSSNLLFRITITTRTTVSAREGGSLSEIGAPVFARRRAASRTHRATEPTIGRPTRASGSSDARCERTALRPGARRASGRRRHPPGASTRGGLLR